MSKFVFRSGAYISGVKPKLAAQELDAIYSEHGQITPEAVVQRAAKKSSALHNAFEWNDGQAATEWRLHQARNLIRAVCVVEKPDNEPRQVFVHVADKKGSAYHPVSVVIAKPSMYRIALNELQDYLSYAHKSFETLRAHGGSAKNILSIGQHIKAAEKAAKKIKAA